MANLLAELAAALASDGEETPPAGWKTPRQWADESGYSRSHTERLLYHGVSTGRVDRRSFRVRQGNRVLPVSHYRVIT